MIDILRQIQEAVSDGQLLFGPHALQQMAQQEPILFAVHVQETILTGEVIEDYPGDVRGPSCLTLGWTGAGEPVHAVVTTPRPYVFVITAYRPSSARWTDDFRNRQMKGGPT